MARKAKTRSDLVPIPMLLHESLYLGIDVGKAKHVAGFVSTTLLERHQRFEACPALVFENSREGFRILIDRLSSYVPLEQVFVLYVRYNQTIRRDLTTLSDHIHDMGKVCRFLLTGASHDRNTLGTISIGRTT